MRSTEFTDKKYRVFIIAPNCFYYQTDIFRALSADPRLEVTVYFCSREGLDSSPNPGVYGSDAPQGADDLLEGYRSIFLKNYSPSPTYLKSITGLMNWGILGELKNNKPDAIVLMSWMNPTWWLSVGAALYWDIPYFLMTDANVHTESYMSRFKKLIRKLLLGRILFKNCSGFLCAGTRNQQLYSLYGAPDSKLFQFAYSAGYHPQYQVVSELVSERRRLRETYGFELNSFIILFCGRLSVEKNPMVLLESFQRIHNPDKFLIFVGDGVQRDDLEAFVSENQIDNVLFTGFLPRDDVYKFYTLADVLVVPSERETWGMVVNEAMCFGMPIVASEAVGAGADLVIEGENGYSYDPEKPEELVSSLNRIGDMEERERLIMAEKSLVFIKDWASRDLPSVMVDCLYNS